MRDAGRSLGEKGFRPVDARSAAALVGSQGIRVPGQRDLQVTLDGRSDGFQGMRQRRLGGGEAGDRGPERRT
jgi:hypothetical protein